MVQQESEFSLWSISIPSIVLENQNFFRTRTAERQKWSKSTKMWDSLLKMSLTKRTTYKIYTSCLHLSFAIEANHAAEQAWIHLCVLISSYTWFLSCNWNFNKIDKVFYWPRRLTLSATQNKGNCGSNKSSEEHHCCLGRRRWNYAVPISVWCFVSLLLVSVFNSLFTLQSFRWVLSYPYFY